MPIDATCQRYVKALRWATLSMLALCGCAPDGMSCVGAVLLPDGGTWRAYQSLDPCARIYDCRAEPDHDDTWKQWCEQPR